MMEEANKGSSRPVPAYQVYVVIGFLRAQGCIEQVGRDGYRVAVGLSDKAGQAWAAAADEA
jgi:hypothetical protein